MSVWLATVESENDGLSLEYKLVEGRARGYARLADFINNPVAQGVVWISGYGLPEEVFDIALFKVRPLADDRGDLFLVRQDPI